jgi:hypothetical protein
LIFRLNPNENSANPNQDSRRSFLTFAETDGEGRYRQSRHEKAISWKLAAKS